MPYVVKASDCRVTRFQLSKIITRGKQHSMIENLLASLYPYCFNGPLCNGLASILTID